MKTASEKAYEAISHQQTRKLKLFTIMTRFQFFSWKPTLFPSQVVHSIPINQTEREYILYFRLWHLSFFFSELFAVPCNFCRMRRTLLLGVAWWMKWPGCGYCHMTWDEIHFGNAHTFNGLLQGIMNKDLNTFSSAVHCRRFSLCREMTKKRLLLQWFLYATKGAKRVSCKRLKCTWGKVRCLTGSSSPW